MVNEIADVKDWEQLAISLGLTTSDIDHIRQYDHREHCQCLAKLWYDRAPGLLMGQAAKRFGQVLDLPPKINDPQSGKVDRLVMFLG